MLTYKHAGVDKEEGYRSVNLIKETVKSTYSPNVLNELGSFGALYELGHYNRPVLVSGTDGVGTKLKIAFELEKYDTIGIDCVAMCVNDILCHGAKPLFFLDYLACGKLDAETAASIVSGMAKGCVEAGASLIGGETAEMPGFYPAGEYDIAGFAVGIVEKDRIVTGEKIKENDLLIALPSSGPHSNGFSLIRRLIDDMHADFNGEKIGNVLLTPTKIYVKPVLEILSRYPINGMAHITGGGLIENVPRIIPEGLCAEIMMSTVKTPNLFRYIQSLGVAEEEMWGTFNMGVGFVLVVDPAISNAILAILDTFSIDGHIIGKIVKGHHKICLI